MYDYNRDCLEMRVSLVFAYKLYWGRRGRECMLIGLTTTY